MTVYLISILIQENAIIVTHGVKAAYTMISAVLVSNIINGDQCVRTIVLVVTVLAVRKMVVQKDARKGFIKFITMEVTALSAFVAQEIVRHVIMQRNAQPVSKDTGDHIVNIAAPVVTASVTVAKHRAVLVTVYLGTIADKWTVDIIVQDVPIITVRFVSMQRTVKTVYLVIISNQASIAMNARLDVVVAQPMTIVHLAEGRGTGVRSVSMTV